MLAITLNLPKWLLAVMVLCVAAGHFQQLKCKLQGCPAVTGHVSAAANPDPVNDDGDCDCQCHLSAFACFELPPTFKALCYVREVELVEQKIAAPEAPCAEIEYPPRSRHA